MSLKTEETTTEQDEFFCRTGTGLKAGPSPFEIGDDLRRFDSSARTHQQHVTKGAIVDAETVPASRFDLLYLYSWRLRWARDEKSHELLIAVGRRQENQDRSRCAGTVAA